MVNRLSNNILKRAHVSLYFLSYIANTFILANRVLNMLWMVTTIFVVYSTTLGSKQAWGSGRRPAARAALK